MSFTDTSEAPGAQVTDLRFAFLLVPPTPGEEGVGCVVRGGVVEATGDSFLFPMDFKASWNGSMAEGCETLLPSSFLIGGAFLNDGSLGLDFAEKNDESVLTPFAPAVTTSFFTAGVGFCVADPETFAAGATLPGTTGAAVSLSFRRLDLSVTPIGISTFNGRGSCCKRAYRRLPQL